MSISFEAVKDFWDYLEYYPGEDEEEYDGIHDGGIKGLRKMAPDSAKKQFVEYQKLQTYAEKHNIKF